VTDASKRLLTYGLLGQMFQERIREAAVTATVRGSPGVQREYDRFAPVARKLSPEAFAALILVVQDEAARRDAA
jgi:hypothetical protein